MSKYVDLEEQVEHFQGAITAFADVTPETVRAICRHGAFVLVNVPVFREEYVVNTLLYNWGRLYNWGGFNELRVVTMENVYEEPTSSPPEGLGSGLGSHLE